MFLSGGDFGGVVKRNILFSRLVGVHRISCVGVRYLRVKEGTSGQEHSTHARRTWRSINILHVHRDDFLCVRDGRIAAERVSTQTPVFCRKHDAKLSPSAFFPFACCMRYRSTQVGAVLSYVCVTGPANG